MPEDDIAAQWASELPNPLMHPPSSSSGLGTPVGLSMSPTLSARVGIHSGPRTPKARRKVTAVCSAMLAAQFRASDVFQQLSDTLKEPGDAASTGYEKARYDVQASFWTQLKILSGRTFTHFFRDPFLMIAHFGTSVLLASTAIHIPRTADFST